MKTFTRACPRNHATAAGSRQLLAVGILGLLLAGVPQVAQGTNSDFTPTVGIATAPDDSSVARLFRRFYVDAGALGRAVATPKIALIAGGALAGTFATAWIDDELWREAQDIYTGRVRDVLEVVDYLGGPAINVPVVLLAGGSLLTTNPRLQDAAWTSLQTLVYAGLIGYGLKGIFGRDRPEWSDDPYDFFSRTGQNPFSHEGNSSYPSGHAIAAFGIITPWVVYYPSGFTYALYALPAGTVISRLALSKHWATDILVGGLIGVSMGRWLARRHQEARGWPDGVSVTVLERGRLFSISLRF